MPARQRLIGIGIDQRDLAAGLVPKGGEAGDCRRFSSATLAGGSNKDLTNHIFHGPTCHPLPGASVVTTRPECSPVPASIAIGVRGSDTTTPDTPTARLSPPSRSAVLTNYHDFADHPHVTTKAPAARKILSRRRGSASPPLPPARSPPSCFGTGAKILSHRQFL